MLFNLLKQVFLYSIKVLGFFYKNKRNRQGNKKEHTVPVLYTGTV